MVGTGTMNRIRIGIGLFTAFWFAACSREADRSPIADTQEAQSIEGAVSDSERLLQRATERWARIVERDFVRAHAYLTREEQAKRPLDVYSRVMAGHFYGRPRVEIVSSVVEDALQVRVFVEWRATGNCSMRFKRDPWELGRDEGFSELEIQERWRREADEWYFVSAHRPE